MTPPLDLLTVPPGEYFAQAAEARRGTFSNVRFVRWTVAEGEYLGRTIAWAPSAVPVGARARVVAEAVERERYGRRVIFNKIAEGPG